MYKDLDQWLEIRKKIFEQGFSQRQICRETGISRGTVRKILSHKVPPGYRRRAPRRRPILGAHTSYIKKLLSDDESRLSPANLSVKRIFEKLRDEHGYIGGYSTVRVYIMTMERTSQGIWNDVYDLLTSIPKNEAVNFLHLLSGKNPPSISQSNAAQILQTYHEEHQKPDKRVTPKQAALQWMHHFLQGLLSRETIEHDVGTVEGIDELLNRIHRGGLSERNKALCILAEARGIPRSTIFMFLGISKTTGRRYLETYETDGTNGLFSRNQRIVRKKDNESIKKAVFSTLHEPPSAYGINRTTWKADDLIAVLAQKGVTIGKAVLRQITKDAGYKWRKARVVLTSNDPEYRDKLQRIQNVLRNLRADEAFFSIDEFGPLAVKTKGGRKLVSREENFTVPQWQKSRGRLIMTAALELSRNQVTHFYCDKKNTDEMIKMMNLLTEAYKGYKTIWLSWDAASWHMSKKLYAHIEAVNGAATMTGSPIVRTAPLPAGAQFLNIIESVFSGLARGVIHNSDYKSTDEVKEAIDRYFADRNDHYRRSPKRAGKKIWGEERVTSEFHAENNCKDPRYR